MSVSVLVRRIARNTTGATAVEYGLICAMIVLVMLASLQLVAEETTSMWGNISQKVQAAR